MNRIVRWYNQNRRIIWISILICIGIYAVIQILNYAAKNSTQKSLEDALNSTTTTNVGGGQSSSVVTEEKVPENIIKSTTNVIDKFMEYCNAKNIEEAYNLLTNECKEQLFPTVQDFVQSYYNRVFAGRTKTYKAQVWISDSQYTYMVQIKDDYLTTGEVSNLSIKDYYTIVSANGSYKLNIDNYVGTRQLNREKTAKDVTVKIVSKDIFMNYVNYNFTVQNNNEFDVILDSKTDINSIYLSDENNLKYAAFTNEIVSDNLKIMAGTSTNITLKFNKTYMPSLMENKLVLSDMRVNNDKITMEIEL
jgi:hypothetical protein